MKITKEMKEKHIRDRTPMMSFNKRIMMTGVHVKYYCKDCKKIID